MMLGGDALVVSSRASVVLSECRLDGGVITRAPGEFVEELEKAIFGVSRQAL